MYKDIKNKLIIKLKIFFKKITYDCIVKSSNNVTSY